MPLDRPGNQARLQPGAPRGVLGNQAGAARCSVMWWSAGLSGLPRLSGRAPASLWPAQQPGWRSLVRSSPPATAGWAAGALKPAAKPVGRVLAAFPG